MKFAVIAPSDPTFAALTAGLNTLNARFDYEELANAYNETPVGAVLKFEYKDGKMSIVGKQLEKRGLARGVDCTVQSAIEGADAEGKGGTHYVYVTRNTDKKAQPVERKTSTKAAAPAAAESTAPAAAEGTAPAATPAGKGKKAS